MKLYFGRDSQRANVTLDLVEENIHFILVAGDEDSGKAFFHRSLYHDLIVEETPSTLRFFFFDAAGYDTREWLHSPFLFAPISSDPDSAFEILERVAEEVERRIFPIPGAYATLIVHIEEDDLVRADRGRFEKVLERILRHKKTSNTFVFYSTSRVDPAYFPKWIKNYVDLRVIFRIGDPVSAKLAAGTTEPTTFSQPGEHLILYKGRKIRSAPFQKITQII